MQPYEVRLHDKQLLTYTTTDITNPDEAEVSNVTSRVGMQNHCQRPEG